MSEAVRLAQELVALRVAAEREISAMQALHPDQPLTPFEKELVRCAFKAGAVFGAGRKEAQTHAEG